MTTTVDLWSPHACTHIHASMHTYTHVNTQASCMHARTRARTRARTNTHSHDLAGVSTHITPCLSLTQTDMFSLTDKQVACTCVSLYLKEKSKAWTK